MSYTAGLMIIKSTIDCLPANLNVRHTVPRLYRVSYCNAFLNKLDTYIHIWDIKVVLLLHQDKNTYFVLLTSEVLPCSCPGRTKIN